VKKLKAWLATHRNDSCLCGSGKKYKKCCLNRVDEFYTRLQKESYQWITPDFRQVLALTCGLKPDKDEYIPEYSQLKESLDEMDKNFFDEEIEEKKVDQYGDKLNAVFRELLKNDTNFQQLRFGLETGLDLMTRINERLDELNVNEQEENTDKASQAYMQGIRTWLTQNIDDKHLQWFTTMLINGLRKRDYSLEERTALLLGLNITVDDWLPVADNPFLIETLRTNFEESLEALNSLSELENEDGTLNKDNAEKLDKLIEQNPVLRGEVERRINLKR